MMQSLTGAKMGMRWKLLLFSLAVLVVITYFVMVHDASESNEDAVKDSEEKDQTSNHSKPIPKDFPSVLFERGVYSPEDFMNENGIVPSFWQQNKSDLGGNVWGPCYPPSETVDWNKTIDIFNKNKKFHYADLKAAMAPVSPMKEDLSNFCRPGFLIIGQGKCGTSSLYHYLTGHPRVVPASEKQIHYFKYFARFPMKWYLGHFPDARTYLASGALMTGEASPGYLPYPNVVPKTLQKMSGAKIICVGRDPLERSWSSYRYNYVNPAIEKFRMGSVKGISPSLSKQEYTEKYLFSFEEMLKAELAVLRKCLSPNGNGVAGAKRAYGEQVFKAEFERRKREGLPPMADLDGKCYGNFHSKEAPRKQWVELAKAQPDKFLNVPSLHLSQAIIGRSLYVYPLEWWYALFPKEDLYFLCTEEMKDLTGEPLNKLGLFLGLPSFNFSTVVAEGMYNVGGHKGYDKVTSWEEVAEEQRGTKPDRNNTVKEEIPLSDEFRKELLEFFQPHNERLFELIGRRCDWRS